MTAAPIQRLADVKPATLALRATLTPQADIDAFLRQHAATFGERARLEAEIEAARTAADPIAWFGGITPRVLELEAELLAWFNAHLDLHAAAF